MVVVVLLVVVVMLVVVLVLVFCIQVFFDAHVVGVVGDA